MQTLHLKVDPNKPNPKIIEIAATLIREGETVAFPTETVYGVGTNGLDEKAVQRVFAAKGRRMNNPLLMHVMSWDQASSLVDRIADEVILLVKKFWPGPLTLVAFSNDRVPKLVTAGLPTVGLRMPDHRVALDLIKAAGVPVAATSANLSGRPSPTSAEHVKNDLNGKIAGIVNAGTTGWGIESTILDVTRRPFAILRPGAVSRERLEEAVPGLIKAAPPRPRRSILNKTPHYRPNAKVIPVKTGGPLVELAQAAVAKGMRVGIVAVTQQILPAHLDLAVQVNGGSAEYGRRLFEIFRMADKRKIDCLYMELPEETGLGVAVADRIYEAASGR
ncbi:MAG: L-threonylcarbamoyladenylate synthase [Syntrophomonadales bacterium]|jgi:L-threonylcarbamoyladenylate synthase